ncbi:hypothetical protein ACIG0C_29570 [Kitasatospora aureofaciens]|uniref:Uncharacterized protein n=1 Tax=Kitasatospora aureofaciens TaxID=1894 RepID=A0A1E7N1S2_KITAU|nr:hypothetical protein [Kitasatospora aureofaciens]ARF82020.1 hypothetical protein B6264_26845 [Kitasatospora aureofaciens]OEV34615.1 hypothetical protein HS99_0008945 [Kitasatospora aureofaciens]GGV01586.1 hypothetical protein GCM10010502_65170 [Kitasatospora aureofaciens]
MLAELLVGYQLEAGDDASVVLALLVRRPLQGSGDDQRGRVGQQDAFAVLSLDSGAVDRRPGAGAVVAVGVRP